EGIGVRQDPTAEQYKECLLHLPLPVEGELPSGTSEIQQSICQFMGIRMYMETLSLSRMLFSVATCCCDDNTVLVRNLLQLAWTSTHDRPLRLSNKRHVRRMAQCAERLEHRWI